MAGKKKTETKPLAEIVYLNGYTPPQKVLQSALDQAEKQKWDHVIVVGAINDELFPFSSLSNITETICLMRIAIETLEAMYYQELCDGVYAPE